MTDDPTDDPIDPQRAAQTLRIIADRLVSRKIITRKHVRLVGEIAKRVGVARGIRENYDSYIYRVIEELEKPDVD